MNRRRLLKATAGFAVLGLAMPRAALADAALRRAATGAANAAEFGLTPNAAENQTSALQALLERASAEAIPIFLPPGRYRLSDLALPRQTRLFGVPGATHLEQDNLGSIFTARDSHHLALSGLAFDGRLMPPSGSGGGLLDIEKTRHIAIENCVFSNGGGNGLSLRRAQGSIRDCAITGITDYALYALDSSGLDVIENTVTDCGNAGILIHRSAPGADGSRVSGNRISRIRADKGGTGQYGNGINAYRADNLRVSDNEIADCAFSAIRGNSAGNLQISGNTCLRSGETALYAEFAFQGAVITGNLVDGAAHGISMANFDKGGRLCACTGNIIRNLSADGPYPSPMAGFGIGINVEADSTVTGNIIENAPLAGIRMGWGPFLRNVTASGNVIRKAKTGIIVSVVEGSGAAVISGNVFEDTPNGAVVGHRWADAATGDLLRSGSEAIPHLTLADNRAG
ncbi:TIGR03808 family TAT-translocated repetitive protein [Nitratireductor kimnyeongensis]|uniref:TIGR03808 family TAT-translocated repetitive protein n=1 Tax=Nitratireductor kimnyeongensis TaxID=430679 RepID=A0ABW0T3L8_9HYPH|nr:TIGR03808 family TAT-translocated repetitive protein [Nitratireductor kimnyeongensis]QZZ34971.1 TIGR03808 family TAT-translocated repetitive protein [Nitratireductor kimnyeongensis]